MSEVHPATDAATEAASAPPPPQEVTRRGAQLRMRLQQLFAFAGLIVICVIFTLANPVFATFSNMTTILFSAVVIGTLALGVTFVIIAAGIDLSIGTGMALCAVMAGTFITNWGIPWPIGVVLTLGVGALIGAVNGTLVAYLRLPPFIATLAMMLVAQGLALVISNVSPIYFDIQSGYVKLSTGSIVPGIPNAVLIYLLAAVVAAVVLSRTLLGRYTFAIGSNQEATALSGIAVPRWTLAIYTFAGLFTALAGILISARLGSAQPATGQGYELYAIAAVVIGGTSLVGGKGSILGTVIGALIIAVIQNGLQLLSFPQPWQLVILGTVILLAVYADMARKKGTT